jgi:transglutaminase-like putative cysteine protease/Tfp pilus assembly protein PilF
MLLLVLSWVLHCFPAVAQQTPAPSQNPYNAEFARIRTEFQKATAPRQAVLLSRAYRIREYIDRADEVRDWFAGVAADSTVNPLVRDEAEGRLAFVQASSGDFTEAERNLVSLGYIRDWSLAGPFAAQQDAVRPKQGFHAADTFRDVHGNSRKWRHVQSLGPYSWLDLADFFPPSAPNGVYAATSVYSESDRVVAFRLSSEAPAILFINGKQVFSDEQRSEFAFDQHAVSVPLQAGWNSVLLKFTLGPEKSSRFSIRITGLHGRGVPLLSSATRDQEPPHPTSVQVSVPAADDLVDMARASANAAPNEAALIAAVGEIEREHARSGALEHLQAAARLEPTANRWLDVSGSCRDAACNFAALTASLRAGPQNVEARIRLADYYKARGQVDRARDLLLEAVAIAPRQFVAREELADIYASAGLDSLALKDSDELRHDFPEPLWLSERMGTRCADLELLDQALPLLKRAYSSNMGSASIRELLANIYRRRHDAPALTQLLHEALTIDPNDTASLAQLADLQLGTGDHSAAARTMQSAIDISPDSDTLRQKFANLLSRMGETSKADEQLAAALQLNPRLDNVRSRLHFASELADDETRYLEDAAKILSRSRCIGIAASTNVTSLSDVRIEHVYENGLSSVRSQQFFCMAGEQDAREFATRLIQYSPSTQELKINHARIYKPDGRVLEGVEGSESSVADARVSMYYDVHSRAVQFPALQKGDIVELDYSIVPTAASNPYGDYFASLVPFRSLMREGLERYVLIAPADRKLNIVEHGMEQHGTHEISGQNEVYKWEARNVPALPNEPRGPSLTELAPYVHVSTFASWNDIGHWYAQLIRPQFELNESLRDLAARLTAGKHSELDKINAIRQYVLRNTRYVALEFGIYSYKPYPVTQVFARRYGDCKDKASLMIALLRQAGIDADIALVRTRALGDVDDRAVSIALFNHAIVYVPKWDLWLDGTAEYAGSRELPLDDQGAKALVVDLDGKSSLRRIPVTKPEDNYTNRVVRARIQPDGAIDFSGTAYTRGEDAPGLRRDYEVAERQRDSFRNSLAQVFPSVRVEDVHVQGANDLERDVNVEFRGVLDTYAGQRVISLTTSWMPRSYVRPLAPLEERTEDVLLSAPWTTDEELHFQLPKGATIISIPQDKSFDTPFGSARIQYKRHGHELAISTFVQFRKLRITPAEYGSFRDFCRDIESAFRAEVKVVLPNS